MAHDVRRKYDTRDLILSKNMCYLELGIFILFVACIQRTMN